MKKTWLDLMDQAGFDAEAITCDAGEDPRQACLFAGMLRENV